jgi:hypothetical protein
MGCGAFIGLRLGAGDPDVNEHGSKRSKGHQDGKNGAGLLGGGIQLNLQSLKSAGRRPQITLRHKANGKQALSMRRSEATATNVSVRSASSAPPAINTNLGVWRTVFKFANGE